MSCTYLYVHVLYTYGLCVSFVFIMFFPDNPALNLSALRIVSTYGKRLTTDWHHRNTCIPLASIYYENMSMQYTEILLALKIKKIQLKTFDIFLIFAQNIDCGYALEPPRRGGSNAYPQSMFWSKK